MFVACLQMQPTPAKPQANLAQIASAARAAAAAGARLLVTPEMSVTGYAIWDDIPKLAQGRDGEYITALLSCVEDTGIAIVAGFPERIHEDIYNTSVFITPDGQKYFYQKCHLFGPHEKGAFKRGDASPVIVEFEGVRAAMLICYDIEFPEMARTQALAGANLILVPTALPAGPSSSRVATSMLPTRALENHIFIIYAGLCGQEYNTAYQGESIIMGPDGELLAKAGFAPALLVAEIDERPYAGMVLDPYLKDRRPDLYRPVTQNCP